MKMARKLKTVITNKNKLTKTISNQIKMKKQILTLSLGLLTLGVFAQKKQLRTAEKALKKNDFATALASIKSLDATIANADDKYKSKYYFLKGQVYAGKKDYQGAAEAFNKLLKFEEKKKKRYTEKAAPILNKMIKEVSEKAFNQYTKSNDFINASKNFYLTYKLSPKDTSYVLNAAIAASKAKDYDAALKYYNELKNLGYTGISTQYLATNIETQEVENLGTKQNRDLMVKLKKYTKPENKITESKKVEIVKNLALILKEQGKTDEAIAAFKEARESDPDDLQLLLSEAFLYNDLKQMDKFEELMREAVKKDPANPDLFFNIGIVNYNEKRGEEAVKYFKKALAINPDYKNANLMLASSMLIKDGEIVKKMNDLSPSDMNGYTKLENERKELFKEILPFLEKADTQNRNVDTVRLLMNIYETLENETKASEYRTLYKSMK